MMTNHKTIAKRKQMILSCQFLSILFMLGPPFKDIRQALRCPGQEGFQHIAQGIAVKMAINVAAVGIRNGSRFFTDDDDDGIGQLADADSRPVPRPQFRRQGPIGGQRKEAAGCIIRFSRIMTAPS